MLVDDGFAFKMRHRIVNVRTFGASYKKCRIRFERDVLDVDVMSAMFAEALQNAVGFLRGVERFHQRIFPAGKIIFLDVDHEQGCFHGVHPIVR